MLKSTALFILFLNRLLLALSSKALHFEFALHRVRSERRAEASAAPIV